jgi:hypothetical protein
VADRTNNLPPEWEATVAAAIAEQLERRKAQVEAGVLMDPNKILREVYDEVRKRFGLSNGGEFTASQSAYFAAAAHRITSYALAYAYQNPPTHMKGFGHSFIHKEGDPKSLVFPFRGKGTGGPNPGPAPGWPDPMEPPDDWDDWEDFYAMPESLYSSVVEERAKYERYPGYWPLPHELGQLLNAVAWKHRAAGWGLSTKPHGTNVPAPDGTPIAEDILHHGPSDTLWDCLGAAGERAEPAWFRVAHHRDWNGRPWKAPVPP